MIHGRKDYNRIQDPAHKIGRSEPVFLIRAKDRAAAFAIEAYAIFAERQGATAEFLNNVKGWAQVVRTWQEQNLTKVPDLPAVKKSKQVKTQEPAEK